MKANCGGDSEGGVGQSHNHRATHKHSHEQDSQVALSLLEFIKMQKLKVMFRKNDNKKPLLEKKKPQEAPDQQDNVDDNLESQNIFNISTEPESPQPEEELTLQELADLLQVQPPANSDASLDVFSSNSAPKSNSLKHSLIKKHVSQNLPEPPADLEQNLQQHLENMQNTVLNELTKLSPLLDEHLMGHVIDCYHRHIFEHLDILTNNMSSPKNSFVLMNWGLKTYLSQELLGHPDLQKMDPIKRVDPLLWTEWGAKAKDRLLENVLKEVRDSLENILQNERTQEHCESEEAYIRLYLDTIQCVNAMPIEAKKISSKLSDYVQKVCLKELLTFVKCYAAEQAERLRDRATTDQPKTIHFLKTLKTCKELRQHVQTKGSSASKETVETLDDLEDFTLKLLVDIVMKIAETRLKNYFNSENRLLPLSAAVKEHFPKLRYGLDEQKKVMDKVYKLIVSMYVKYLIQTNKSKLEKCWNPNVGQRIREDAEQLHTTFSELAPGIEQKNKVLLKITELVDCNCKEALKLTAAELQAVLTVREDPELPALLKWKGLSNGEVSEVLHAVHHDNHSRTSSGSLSVFTCWKG